MPTRPSPRSERLGTPNTPAIRFTRGPLFEASLVRHCYGLSGCSPPWTDLTGFRRPPGAFYIQASDGSVALPVAGYDYNRWGNGPGADELRCPVVVPDRMKGRGYGVHQPQASRDGERPWSILPVWTCL